MAHKELLLLGFLSYIDAEFATFFATIRTLWANEVLAWAIKFCVKFYLQLLDEKIFVLLADIHNL